jgi:CheY-like chemotaxis protein
MKEKLDILVVEDNPLHQESARRLLADHNLTLVGTFDEAADFLNGSSNYAPKKIEQRKYDAVLTDMFLPQGRGDCQRDRSQASVENPFGYPIALLACKKEVPYVAILSQVDHHSSPMAYSMDLFILEKRQSSLGQILERSPTLIEMKKSRLLISDTSKFSEEVGEGKYAKNWKAALDYVMTKQ